VKKKTRAPAAAVSPAELFGDFVERGHAAQRAVDQAIAAAATAPNSTANEVAAAAEAFGAWRRCLGGPKNDCQAWARDDRGCPRHRFDTRPAVQGAPGAQREPNHPRRGR